jgi:hypothetical protein
MASSEHLQKVAIGGNTLRNGNSFVGRPIDIDEVPARKTTYLQLCLAFLFSNFWFWAGGLRTEDLGHDFQLYSDQVTQYYSPSEVRFPDLLFHSIATGETIVLDLFGIDKALAARFFFLTIAFLQAVLLFIILRYKRPAETCLIAIGFAPLIFLDIIRQGLAMLLAGAFLIEPHRKKAVLLVFAFATHLTSIVSIAAFDVRKLSPAIAMSTAVIILILGWFLIDDLTARYVWYSTHEGYLLFEDVPDVTAMKFSYLNAIVLLFFAGSIIAGFLPRQEGGILILLYLLSMAVPLFFRTYLFYLFAVTCSRDVFVRKWSIGSVLFNIGYAILVLRMVPLTFVETDALE